MDDGDDSNTAGRRRWMGLLARADGKRLRSLAARWGEHPHVVLRGPETGLVMIQGRTGATGSPFNLGEMSVTRCSIRLASGTVGHAYVSGRDGGKAHVAAILDALMLDGTAAEAIEAAVLRPLETHEDRERAAKAAKSAATRVEFFTMVRSEHGGRD